LQAGDDETNEKEFPEIRDGILLPFQEDGVPVFLVGDMNVAAAEPAFPRLLETTGMQAFPLDDPSPFTVDGKNSWNKPNKRAKHIDHVLVNPRGTATTIARQTIQRARREHEGRTMDLADHYGVVAEIVIQK
jgi:endonuclease/exonuclease/phosphatase family metal-dependent hydrolase